VTLTVTGLLLHLTPLLTDLFLTVCCSQEEAFRTGEGSGITLCVKVDLAKKTSWNL